MQFFVTVANIHVVCVKVCKGEHFAIHFLEKIGTANLAELDGANTSTTSIQAKHEFVQSAEQYGSHITDATNWMSRTMCRGNAGIPFRHQSNTSMYWSFTVRTACVPT
mmetsp:Transcript_24014/g.66546  ORF Transcript_24014/g.66546 Transcript_24014/m.66546 type:complete len:108 (+) Transcript_24014:1375-1698(+)